MSAIAKKSTKTALMAYFTLTDFYVDYEVEEEQRVEFLENWKEQFVKNKFEALYLLGFSTKHEWFSPSLLFLYRISDTLIKKLAHQSDIELTRADVSVSLTEEEITALMESVPYTTGMEYVTSQWISHLWEELRLIYATQIQVYDGSVAAYFTEHNSNINIAGRVFFHLVESKESQYPFAFLATYSTKPPRSKKAVHTPLKQALSEFKKSEKELYALLVTVTKAAEKSNFISNLMESGELFSPLRFTSAEAYTFFSEIPIYEEAGIMCRVPDWWRKHSNSIQLCVTVGEKEPSKVGLAAIMDFTPSLFLDGERITEKELREFLTMAEGLVQYKGKWIEINNEKLTAVLQAFERANEIAEEDAISLGDAIRMELAIDQKIGAISEEVEITVSNGAWLRGVKETLNNPSTIHEIAIEPTLHASLRTYQESGYQWLHHMSTLGFGACLADDMGLGKTIQMIAYLEYVRVRQGGSALLILPASLIGNWQNEIKRFAPNMTYQILHKSAVSKANLLTLDETVFLSITTYGMAMRLDELQHKTWDYLILDEAQAIKNPGTKQTKMVKQIPAKMRIAMTGTPIENKLGDLWSLFDFLNQGLLGSAKEFTTFSKNIAENTMQYAKLRKTVNPFILRRLKTDKRIISDLPDKIETKEYAGLSKKQIGLYQLLVKEIAKKLEDAEGIQRKGLVLSSITKFKQICNHPDQYLGQEEYKVIHSGKFEQLKCICETIYEKRERVLVFTQFKEMTEPLSELLTEIFHKKGLVLHGGTSVKNRNLMVERFNSEEYVPYMVLSLKAGGVGLNLTAANHVIHFDRWWNPAVENQATDRAFRIGQTKNVMVYKFVTQGTIEEKIDEMITSKEKLAGDILASSGEQWITELNNTELIELFTLGGV